MNNLSLIKVALKLNTIYLSIEEIFSLKFKLTLFSKILLKDVHVLVNFE